MRLGHTARLFCTLACALAAHGEKLPTVANVEWQPLAAQAERVAAALELLGDPLPAADHAALKAAKSVEAIQDILDKHCLVGVNINPESRVKVQQGEARAELMEQGWRTFLVKVHNEAGITAVLAAESPNAGQLANASAGVVGRKWMDMQMFNRQPLKGHLSGLEVEYRILQIYAKDAGKREGKLLFDVGQGTQDLGFRSEADILFTSKAAAKVTFRVLDWDNRPATAGFEIRDEKARVYPSQAKRLGGDFFFHPQVYRASGESVNLPPGRYTVKYSRGPEYRGGTQQLVVSEKPMEATFRLERWIDPAKLGWYSGDHHIHAAGCAHYERPTEGVYPQDMMRHVMGEDLKIGSVLTWGPGWYFQKTFFEGKDNAVSTKDYKIRYDVEVSGHPSSHTGHLVLLGLKEQDFPGTHRIEDWPSWGVPILKWAKGQNAVTGYAHSGWGLVIPEPPGEVKRLSYAPMPFDGIGANEYIVSVAHGAADFISTVDTPWPYELTIWYHTLNSGYRTRISGETDFPCIYGERVGLGRSYVKQKALDYADWVQGIKEGRNYVSDGRSHILDFQAGSVAMGMNGSEIVMAKPGGVRVKAKVAALLDGSPDTAIRGLRVDEKPFWHIERARLGASRKVPVELIVNGEPMARREIEADGSIQEVVFDAQIDRSSWIALRILPSSHTNPVWVTVGGKPVRERRSIEWALDAVDRCYRQKIGRIRLPEQGAMTNAYEFAKEQYKARLQEARQ